MADQELQFLINIDPRQLAAATRAASGFDTALESARRSADNLDNALYALPTNIAIDARLDTSQVQRSLDGISLDETITIHAQTADLENAQRIINDIGASAPIVTINASDAELNTALDTIDDIDTAAPTVTINANDLDLDTAKDKVDDLDAESATVRVDASTTGADTALNDIESKLNDLRALAVIDITMSVGAGAAGVVSGAAGFISNVTGVSAMVETDTAVTRLNYTIGQTIPNAEELINSLFSDNWGESRTELGEMIEAAAILGVEFDDLESAITAAYQTAAITGFEVEETLRAQQSLVKNGLAPDFQAAGTVIAAAFQSGANVGDDLLDTINEYGSTFAAMGFTTDQVLSTLNSGLAAGADNTDRIADAVREFGIKAREGTEEFSAAIEELDLSELYDDFLSGEATGAEFFGELTAALGEVEDTATAAALATATIGTQSEDFTVDVIADIDPFQEQLAEIETASQSMELVGTDLQSQITEFGRFIETTLHEALQDAFDLDEIIENAKSAIETFMGTIESGGSIAEAIGAGLDQLELPFVEDLQQTLAGFIIGFLQAVGTVTAALGGDTSGIRETIATISESQLVIDVQMAEGGEQISNAVSTALERGVSTTDLYRTLTENMQGAIENGDFGLAAAINEEIQTASSEMGVLMQAFESSGGNQQRFAAALLEQGIGNWQENLATFWDVQAIVEDLDAANVPTDYFQQVGEFTSAAFGEAYFGELQTLFESGELGQALDLAAAVGDTEAITALGQQISQQFVEAIDLGDTDLAAQMSGDVESLLAVLNEQLAANPEDSGLETWITELETRIADISDIEVPPVISEEDVAASSAAADSLGTGAVEAYDRITTASDESASEVEANSERTITAVSGVAAAAREASKGTERSYSDTNKAASRTAAEMTSSSNTSKTAVQQVASTTQTQLPLVSASFALLETQLSVHSRNIVGYVNSIKQQIATIPTVPSTTIPATGSTPATPPPSSSTPGGFPSGSGTGGAATGSPTGGGPPPDMAAAYDTMSAGGGTVYNTYNTVNYVNIDFNSTSQAQDLNAMFGTSKALKAYGA